MKTVIVGDIHGRFEYMKAFMSMASEDTQVIFVGDFLDSFDRNVVDQMACLMMAVDARHRGENIKVCRANHEQSYLDPHARCSGWRQETQSMVDAYGKARIDEALLDWVWLEFHTLAPILVSHAGVTANWFDMDPDNIGQHHVQKWLETTPMLYAAGRARGGRALFGGVLWCDWWREFEPIPSIRQVVGHSNVRLQVENRGVVMKRDNYNIDCLERTNEYVEVDEKGVVSIKEVEV